MARFYATARGKPIIAAGCRARSVAQALLPVRVSKLLPFHNVMGELTAHKTAQARVPVLLKSRLWNFGAALLLGWRLRRVRFGLLEGGVDDAGERDEVMLKRGN